jgi:transcriptional regulator with XRE-family HTH domain
MPSGAQIKAARALLGITAAELAEGSAVTLRTIQRFERAEGTPASRSGTLDRIEAALAAQGIEFIGDPMTSPGVRLHRKRD